MRTRVLPATAAGLALLLAAGTLAAAPATAGERPNVVFILLDDLDFEDLGSYGATRIRTPALDRLASQGMRFTHFYTNGTVCSPTRAALLTGRHPSRFGFKRSVSRYSSRGIPTGVPLISEVLRGAGYRTAHIGKWHVGQLRPEHRPRARGFDFAVRHVDGDLYTDFTLQVNDQPPVRYRDGEHPARIFTDHALEFIDRGAGPFFLNLWYNLPHDPFLTPPGFDNSATDYDLDTAEGRFAAMVTAVDREIRRIVAKLDELGLDNTLLVVASDNGGLHTVHRQPDRRLRGFKSFVYEGGIRVPMIVRWPGAVAAGAVSDALVVSFDLFPTLAGAAGAGAGSFDLDGRSFLPVLLGRPHLARGEPLFWESKITPQLSGGPTDTLGRYAVRRGRWKLVADGREPMLFDLAQDPGEKFDLAAQFPEKLRKLGSRYAAWRAEVSEIPYQLALSPGGATPAGDAVIFDGGRGTIPFDGRFDFHDGDWSFLARLTPRALAADAVLAGRGRSWRLALRADGVVELALGDYRGSAVLTSAAAPPLAAGDEHHVAFTVFGWPGRHATVRLYLDGALVDESTDEVLTVRPGDDPILIANDEAFAAPFRGEIEAPFLAVNAFSHSEVEAWARRWPPRLLK